MAGKQRVGRMRGPNPVNGLHGHGSCGTLEARLSNPRHTQILNNKNWFQSFEAMLLPNLTLEIVTFFVKNVYALLGCVCCTIFRQKHLRFLNQNAQQICGRIDVESASRTGW